MIADKLIAHRGWQQQYPENTLIAIASALAAGARNIEIDIQLSADGVPVLCHDSSLLRLCNINRAIEECTLDTLSGFSVYEPDRLGDKFLGTGFCTLAECLALIGQHPEVKLYIEIKRHAIRQFGAQTILDILLPMIAPLQQQCVLISFDFPILAAASKQGWQSTGPILELWQDIEKLPGDNQSIDIVFCNHEKIPAGIDIPSLPYPLAVYEVAELELAHKLLAEGIHRVESFAIGELLAAASAEQAKQF